MTFTDDEIRDIGLNQLTASEFVGAKAAVEGFETLFNRPWVEAFFQGLKSKFMVLYLSTMWRAWSLVRVLPKGSNIQVRWSKGPTTAGVTTEVLTIARLLEQGAIVELFPEVAGRVPDARFRVGATEWVYLEVSKRNLSEPMRWAQQVINQLSTAASEAVQGRHGKIGVRRAPSKDELLGLLNWLQAQDGSESYYGDLAVFHSTELSDGAGDSSDPSLQFVPQPRMFCTAVALGGSESRKGTAVITVPDSGAAEALRDEAAQLPAGKRGVVLLDITGVVGGAAEWAPQIRRRLQPSLNTRVAAVVLFSATLADNGLSRSGQLILNQYASQPADSFTESLLRTLIS